MRSIGATVVVFVCVLSVRMIGGDAAQPGPPSLNGRDVFRYDTFGDEQLWTGTLRMHEVVNTVDPVTAPREGEYRYFTDDAFFRDLAVAGVRLIRGGEG